MQRWRNADHEIAFRYLINIDVYDPGCAGPAHGLRSLRARMFGQQDL